MIGIKNNGVFKMEIMKCELCSHSRRVAGKFCYCVTKGNTVRMADKGNCDKFGDKESIRNAKKQKDNI